jgi:TolB-like protein/Flp pilus assembly protein TadD
VEGLRLSRAVVRFGSFELDQDAGELRRDGTKVRLQEQPLRILQILLEQPAKLVPREELQRRIWPTDTFVDFDHGINNAIKRLREALGDIADTPSYIETLPRRGYRFVGKTECDAAKTRSLAVLPLEDLSHDPEREYFADGLTEALITILAKIGDLRVISRTSTMQYKGVHKNIREIARELDVDTIVEGTVLRVGQRVRITAQLIEVVKETHLWAESYERDLRDVLALQSEIAQSIAREIRVKLTPHERAQIAQTQPVDPDAYEAYLKGRYYWNKSSGDTLTKGAECFRRAIDRDPDYAAAYSGLADCASRGCWLGHLAPEDGFGKAKKLATQALTIAPNLAEAYASLGFSLTHYDFDFLAAERAFERSLELNPHYATGHQWFAMLLYLLGRDEAAFARFATAVRLDPLAPIIHAAWGWICFLARRYDEALERTQTAFELDPSFLPITYPLGTVHMFKGEEQAAFAAYNRGVDVSAGAGSYLGGLGWGFAKVGRKDDAKRVLTQLCEMRKHKYVMAINIALIHAELSEKEEALRWLEQGFEERAAWMVYLNADPRYDNLRSEPRFQQLLRRMNLQREYGFVGLAKRS